MRPSVHCAIVERGERSVAEAPSIIRSGTAIHLELGYSPLLYERSTMTGMLEALGRTLERLVANPQALVDRLVEL